MNNLSVVIITLNEEKNIARCIRSVQNISDDIIVVDDFSSDKTPEICKSLNVNLYQKKWEGYGKAKNYGNSLAKYDWILSIDADEEIAESLAKKIIEKIHADKYAAYYISCLTNYCGQWIKHGKWFPDYHIRLFKKKYAQWDEQEVHEALIFSQSVNIGKIRSHYINHYTISSLEEHKKKIEHYSSLAAQKMFRLKKQPTFIKRYVSPVFKFIVDYFFRLGFLDGIAGFHIARLTSYETYLKYKKLNILYKSSHHSE